MLAILKTQQNYFIMKSVSSDDSINSDDYNKNNKLVVIKNLDTDICILENELEVLQNNRERKKKNKMHQNKKMEISSR